MPETADRLLITQDGIRLFLREIVWYNDTTHDPRVPANTVKCGVRYPMVDPQRPGVNVSPVAVIAGRLLPGHTAQLVRALDFWVTSGDAIFRTRKVLKGFDAGAYLAMDADEIEEETMAEASAVPMQ
jgi:hypothetical protein